MQWFKAVSFVDDPKKYSSLAPTNSKALKKRMEEFTRRVERKIAEELPSHLAVILDGWTHHGTFYLPVFFSFESENEDKFSTVAGFSTLTDGENMSSEAQVDFLSFVVNDIFNKSWDNVSAMIGDNCNTNKKIANVLGKPFIGCASH